MEICYYKKLIFLLFDDIILNLYIKTLLYIYNNDVL